MLRNITHNKLINNIIVIRNGTITTTTNATYTDPRINIAQFVFINIGKRKYEGIRKISNNINNDVKTEYFITKKANEYILSDIENGFLFNCASEVAYELSELWQGIADDINNLNCVVDISNRHCGSEHQFNKGYYVSFDIIQCAIKFKTVDFYKYIKEIDRSMLGLVCGMSNDDLVDMRYYIEKIIICNIGPPISRDVLLRIKLNSVSRIMKCFILEQIVKYQV